MLRILLTSTVCVVSLSAATTAELDWPQYRGPHHTGISADAGLFAKLKDGPAVAWKANVGTGFAAIAIAKGRAYTVGNTDDQDSVCCFDAATGKPAAGWKNFTFPAKLSANGYEGGPNATPTCSNGKVYGLSKDGAAYCLDATTGAVAWNVNLASSLGAEKPAWGFASSPLVLDGKVYLNVGKVGVCLDAATGAVAWKSGPGKAGYATVVALGTPANRQFAVFSADKLFMLKSDGGILWDIPWKSKYDVNAADPLIRGTQICISTGYGIGSGMFDFASGTPKEIWKNQSLRTKMSPSVLIGDYIYGYDENMLRCVSWTDGTVKWEQKGIGQGTLVANENRLVILSEKGELVIANASPDAFKEVTRGQVLTGRCWTPPAIAGGRIFCRNAKGDVVAVEIK